ncbi:MAG: DUF5117 domain-containing protein, partial [Planctomycetota bacterium]
MKKKCISLFLVLTLAVPHLLWGQSIQKPQKPNKNFGPFSRKIFASSASSSQKKFPPFQKVVKDMIRKEGFFPLYVKGEKMYGLVRFSQIKRPFFLATTISKGIYAGMQWDDMLVYWKVFDNKLLLVRPNLRYKGGRKTLKGIVEKTYPATIIRALPILTKGPEGYLVNFGRIFKSNLSGVSLLARSLLGVMGALNPSLSRWTKIKTFPHNIEVEVDLAFTGVKVRGSSPNFSDSVDSRTHFLGVHYSLSYLPRTNYQPRVADDRVGYFQTAFKDFSTPYESKTKFKRYIHRWHLEKADPSLKLSPPKKPIVFYIEKTVPIKFRRYVREAILEWNKAFEKIGILNAIEVRQQTDTEFADLDPEDVRYNFFRWVTNDYGFAAGPSRVNPLTGQILDADIIFDDSMLRYVSKSYQNLGPVSNLWEKDTKFQELLKTMKGWNFGKDSLFFPQVKGQEKEENLRKMLKILAKKGRHVCLFTYGMKHQLAMASLMFHARGIKKIPLEFLGEYVKEIVMHELGHTLGLYHNFKASSWRSLKEINSKEKPAQIVGSVMDYNPVNFAPKGVPQGHFLTQTIGPYDYWAIEYGYKIIPRGREAQELQKIASRAGENGLQYGNDLYASLADPDPLWIRWDLGNNPIEYAKFRMELGQQILKDLLKRAVKDGES